MKIDTLGVSKLGSHLLQKHELSQRGWTFGFDRAKTRCGQCDFHQRRITVSIYYVRDRASNVGDIQNTILHEIAHALAGYEAGHNHEWKRIALSIGCDGKVTCDNWQGVVPGNYRIKCECGSINVERYRLSSKLRNCVCASCRTLRVVKCCHSRGKQ
jgi:predicted SprT family Zn-dependent metalloprotease